MYSGEWEWVFGPAAMSKDNTGTCLRCNVTWLREVDKRYLELDAPFATEQEIWDKGLTKMEAQIRKSVL